jgi:hypothetical protein
VRFFRLLTCVALVVEVGACADRGITDPSSERTFRVEGVVTSAADGSSLSGVLVRVYKTECPGCTLMTGQSVKVTYGRAYSDDSGYYELAGDYEIRSEAHCGGLYIEAIPNSFFRDATKFLDCGSHLQEMNFALRPVQPVNAETVTLKFTGEVRFNGQPVDDAEVWFWDCYGAERIDCTPSKLATTTTESDGRYTLTYTRKCVVGENIGPRARLWASSSWASSKYYGGFDLRCAHEVQELDFDL